MVVRRADFALPRASVEPAAEPAAKKPPEPKEKPAIRKGWLARDPDELKRRRVQTFNPPLAKLPAGADPVAAVKLAETWRPRS